MTKIVAMKYLIVLFTLCFAIIFLDSCKKESLKIAHDNSQVFIGKWELRQSVGHTGTIGYEPGNGASIKFTDSSYVTTDNNYLFFLQGSHQNEGSYKIVADSTVNESTGLEIAAGQFENRIILDNDTASVKIFFQLSDNKLIILSGYFPTDAAVKLTYEKQ